MNRLVSPDQWLRQMRHLTPLHAVLLTLLAFGMASALPIHSAHKPVRPVGGPAAGAAVGAAVPATVAALLAITTDSQSVVAQLDAARAANSTVPLLANALQTARPFDLGRGLGLGTGDRAQQCLALAMYYEAGFEGRDGRAAVAQVVLNRMRHPAFPHDVCSVVFQHTANNICQFTFACDGAMQRPRLPALWRQSLDEAAAALHGKVYAAVGMATHYHADYVFPSWATRLEKVAVIGQHLFYRWPGGWGQRGAFTARYNGTEAALEMLDLPLPELAGAPPELLLDLPPEIAAAAGQVAPIQSVNEAGFVDPSKGWVPRVSQPQTRGAAVAAPPAPTP